MKVLITGVEGQLGYALKHSSPKFINGREIKLFTTNRNQLDFSSPSLCYQYIIDLKPDWVINAAAFTAVDLAEEQHNLSYKVNSESPREIAKALNEIGGKLIHISTDYVFKGDSGKPYKTFDKRYPLNTYGKSKAMGEDNIRNVFSDQNNAIILRTSWLMGAVGKNFVLKMLHLIEEKNMLKVISDQVSAPTSTRSLSDICWRLITNVTEGKNVSPVLHWSDAGVASWYDVAYAISEFGESFNLIKKAANIVPVKSSEYPTIAVRPSFSVLDISDTILEIGQSPLNWRHELMKTVRQISLYAR